MEQDRKFSQEELRSFNGQNGKPVYIAHNGRVFDVTASKMWRGGMHMKRHAAGQDLSAEMGAAPHGVEVLDRYPQVGVLEERQPAVALSPAASALPPRLERFLTRHPFFLRHPHPMTVHFPIAFLISAPVFTALFLITGVSGFEVTAFNCLGGGLFFCLVVIPTGLFTWWVYYQARPMRPVRVKIVVSLVMLADVLGAFLWRILDPQVARSPAGVNALYLVMVFLLLPLVLVVAWFGATLTFPLRREAAGAAPAAEEAVDPDPANLPTGSRSPAGDP